MLAPCSCGTAGSRGPGLHLAAGTGPRWTSGAAAPGTAGETWAAGTRPPWGPSQGMRAAAAQALGCAGGQGLAARSCLEKGRKVIRRAAGARGRKERAEEIRRLEGLVGRARPWEGRGGNFERDPSPLNKSRHEGKDFVMIIATTEASIIIATICPVFICASAGVSFFFFFFFTYFTYKEILYIFFQLYFMAVVSKK